MPDKVTSDKVFTELREMLGHRLSDDIIERLICSQDMAPIPKQLLAILRIRNVPDYVVRPISTEEVAEVVRFASDQRVSITARAGATSALFNAVPTRQGIVLDVKSLRGIVQLDEDDLSVTVRAGTTFAELEDELAQHDLALMSYPSSAPSATVGGWLCTGGYGIGSLKFGPFADQVVSAEVVSPTGDVYYLENKAGQILNSFPQSDGTLGIVSQIKLKVRSGPEAKIHHAFSSTDLAAVQNFLCEISAAQPFFVAFHDDRFNKIAQRGVQLAQAPNSAPDRPLIERSNVLVSLQGERDAVSKGLHKARIIATAKGLIDEGETAGMLEWDQRFRSLRVKQVSPGIIGTEVMLPVERLESFVNGSRALAANSGLEIGSYGYLAGSGRLLVFSMLPIARARMTQLLFYLPLLTRLYDLAIRRGGRPYGIGLWNAPYIDRILGKAEMQERRKWKSQTDPVGILNPGKGIDAPRFFALSYELGTRLLGLGLTVHKRRLPPEGMDIDLETSTA